MAFQAKLITKLQEYSVDDAIIELKNSIGKSELTQVVVCLLKQLERDDLEDVDEKKFDFIVGGRLLRTSISDHFELYADELDAREILNEKLVEIEYTIPLESPKPSDTFEHNDWVRCVDLNDSYMVTGSYDNSISIFSLNDRKKLVTITEGHNQPITGIRFITPSETISKTISKSRSNKKSNAASKNAVHFISSGYDETSRLWRFDTIKLKCDEIIVFRGHKRSVDCLDVQQDLLVTGGYDKTIKIWSSLPEPDDNELNQPGAGDSGCMSDDDDEKVVRTPSKASKNKRKKVKAKQDSSKNINGNAQISRNPTITLTGHKDGVRGVRWLNNGTGPDSLASCSLDGLILLWDVETGSETRKFVSAKPMLKLDHNANSNQLITASCDRFVRLWDTRLPNESRASAVFSSHTAWVSSVAFSAAGHGKDNHFVSGGYDNLVKLWDLRSPKACLYDLIGHHDRVFDVNCNNTKFVASGSADSTVRLYAT